MTGPEHYKEAERLGNLSRGQELESATVTLQEAQVHATLALAAATALMDLDQNSELQGLPIADYAAWRKVAATKDGA